MRITSPKCARVYAINRNNNYRCLRVDWPAKVFYILALVIEISINVLHLRKIKNKRKLSIHL